MGEGKHVRKPSIVSAVVGILVMLAMVVGLSWLMRMYVFQAYQIPSGSMEDTIAIGDMVFAEKMSYYTRDPEPGEIVTFADPSGVMEEATGQVRVLIKRVIATAGQVVDIKDGKLYIDGKVCNEDYVDGKPTYALSSSKVTYPYTVPQGCIWVMGDNRTNSQDSRYFGAVPISSVTARAVFTYWPLEHIGGLG